MKKFASILTAAAVAASAMTFTASAEGGSLVVLGDSITSGYGLDGYTAGDNTSAADSFANRLAAGYQDYSNFAVDGRTSAELLTALDDADVSAALAGADTIVISIGGNDFLQPMITALMTAAMQDPDIMNLMSSGADVSEDDYAELFQKLAETVLEAAKTVDTSAVVENISEIFAKIGNTAPEARVIILTVYDPFEGVTGMEMFDVVAREKLAELNSGITETAAAYGADVVDVFTAFKGHALDYTNIASMDIHPNRDGHAVIYSMLSDIAAVPTSGDTGSDGGNSTASDIQKGSPDTGAEGVAVFAGIAALAGAGILVSRRRK